MADDVEVTFNNGDFSMNHDTTTDGREVTIRAVAWIDRNEAGEVTSLRAYKDQSLLWFQS